ncbi:three-Cys-motif partner protein TcmP [Synechococcus elongatus PCC 11802]|nr:three-Cys-motif partner protein TcmP [Synechococcus elongatus]
MTSNSFFDEQGEQSLVKARIVEKYFSAWAKVMIATIKSSKIPNPNPRIAYVDLFAGPGRYKDGAKSTPVKVLESAISHPDMKNMLVSVFNDADVENYNSLREAINAIPNISDLKHEPQIVNHEVGENIVRSFQEGKLVPTLSFVDPWGYKGLSLQLINSVLKDWGCDCIFFFNYNRINMGLGNNAVKDHIDALFGKERASRLRELIDGCSSPQVRELTIIEAICNSLEEMGGRYVLPF